MDIREDLVYGQSRSLVYGVRRVYMREDFSVWGT